MFEVFLAAQARRFYAQADRPLARKLAHAMRMLEQEPHRHPNIKALSGALAGHYRFRVGDHRLVYFVDDAARAVHIVRIAHRSEIYR